VIVVSGPASLAVSSSATAVPTDPARTTEGPRESTALLLSASLSEAVEGSGAAAAVAAAASITVCVYICVCVFMCVCLYVCV
jgi:ABC-type sugar transport system permease subunit